VTGTSGKECFSDRLSGQVRFDRKFNHDTILNFAPGLDQIDLSAVVSTAVSTPGSASSRAIADQMRRIR